MKKIASVAAMALVVLFMARCTENAPDEEADRTAIQGLIAGDSVWFSGSTEVESTGTGGSFTDGDTWFVWWRSAQTHSEPDLIVEVIGDSAWVEWSRKNFGYVYTMTKPPDTTWLLWTKNLVETATVRAVFRRNGDQTGTADRGWQLSHVSLVAGASDSTNTLSIDSVRVQSTSNPDLLIMDPLNTYYDVTDLIGFDPGEVVTLTLYTNATEARAFLHTFVLRWPFYVRVEFQDQGDGVFRGVWPAQVIPFPRFAIFDLLHKSTIQREEWDYDFAGWLFPYQIREP